MDVTQPAGPEGTTLRTAEPAFDRLRAIQSVTDAALAHLALDDLLRSLLERIAGILSADTVAILLLDPAEQVLVARAARGIEEEVERGVRIPVGHGFAGRIASSQRPIVLDDVRTSDVLNPILLEKGIRSMLGVPLVVEGETIGVLHVGSLTQRRFTPADIEVLQVVADRVALAIDRAHHAGSALAARRDADVAEEAVRARDEFIAIAAHELRNPLTGVKAAAQLLRRRSGSLEPEQLRIVETLERQVDKLARLVTHLLETVRIQTDKLSLQRAPTDVLALARDVVAEMAATSGRPIDLVRSEAIVASVDPLRIEQVLTNIIDNALKYSPADAPIEVEVSQVARAAVRIAVRDHGTGVEPARRPYMFERFYRAHADRSGMGLGLYICRVIVEEHGGTIYAEFPADGGTRMVVSLPLDAAGMGAVAAAGE